ncbi:MAG: glycosyltransferase family 4 protein [bacterium]|nr:glycosyltransferase family 4 protein [bacterium]
MCVGGHVQMIACPILKVLHVCTVPSTARAFVAPLASYLETRGYEVTIACSEDPNQEIGVTMEEMRAAGFRMKEIPIPRLIQPIGDLRATLELYRFIRKERFAIVHTQTTKAGFVGRLAASLARAPVIIHSAYAFPFHPYLPAMRRKVYAWMERVAAKWADLVMVPTDAVRLDGLYHQVAPPEKILTVPMGINLQRFSRQRTNPAAIREEWGVPFDAPVVGSVARLVPDKGLECFLDAAARVAALNERVRFLIVGDGPLRRALEQQAQRLGIADRVIFAGMRSDIPEQMAAMDLFVLPTLREGFGVVLAESMAMGVPVVASDIPALLEVVANGETGILLPPGDPERFAVAILDLLRDETRRLAMGAAGRRRVELLFDERQIFARIEATYTRLLRLKGHQSGTEVTRC